MSHLDSLAGLDSMVLHINTHSNTSPTLSSTAITLDGESYVLVPRKKKKLERASRTPFADKTQSFNNSGGPILNSGVPRRPDAPSVYQDSSLEPILSPCAIQPNHIPKLPSFKLLPPMQECSPLRTSFLDFSLHSVPPMPESHSTATPPIHLSVLPQGSLVQDQPKSADVTPPKIHDEPFLIPAFQHPNSPYVPWAPPLRRRILQPFPPGSRASVLSNSYSRPVSRSGARAPEPTETPEPTRTLPKNWKQLRQTISKGVNRVMAHFATLKWSFLGKRPASPSTAISYAGNSPVISQDDLFFPENYSPLPISPLATLTQRRIFTQSTVSLASSDSATLAAWLAARQRASHEERDYDPASMMSLEEYERLGSWLELSGDRKSEGKWVCGVPGCEIHAQHMLMHGGQVTTLDFVSVKESWTQGSSPRLQHHTSCGSSPQCQARTSSGRRRNVITMTGDRRLSAVLDRQEVERSMPGGWTF